MLLQTMSGSTPPNFSRKYTLPASAVSLPAAEVPALLRADVDLPEEDDFGLLERRRATRLLPCPDAVECDDEASWSQWNELMMQADPSPAAQQGQQPLEG